MKKFLLSNKLGSSVLLFSAAVVLGACSAILHIGPSGSLESGVLFKLVDPSSDNSPSKPKLREFSVHVHDRDGNLSVVWAAKGRSRTSVVEYGIPPKGMEESITAARLLEAHVYSVNGIASTSIMGPPATGIATFYVDLSGNVSPCDDLPSCWSKLDDK